MKDFFSKSIARWSTSLALTCFLALSTLVLSSSPTFAAACNPGTPLDASGGSASCDMTIAAQVNPGVLTLANDAAANVPGTPFTLNGTPILATFTFNSVVRDHRGSTAGWALLAASAGLKNGTTTLPLNLTAADPASTCINGTCPATTFTPVVPLTTTAATFLTAGNAAHTIIVDGDYTNRTDGTFTIPTGSPAGSYTGIITITLSNVY
jgi:hypothetical protein